MKKGDSFQVTDPIRSFSRREWETHGMHQRANLSFDGTVPSDPHIFNRLQFTSLCPKFESVKPNKFQRGSMNGVILSRNNEKRSCWDVKEWKKGKKPKSFCDGIVETLIANIMGLNGYLLKEYWIQSFIRFSNPVTIYVSARIFLSSDYKFIKTTQGNLSFKTKELQTMLNCRESCSIESKFQFLEFSRFFKT